MREQFLKTNRKTDMNKKKTPWPTKDAMAQVYEKKLWGGTEFDFYSGDGSRNPKIVLPYIDAIISFLTSFKTPLIICDIGCGDFNIGKQLVEYSKKYIAIDIVAELIVYNKEKFKQQNLEFHCLDAAVDDLPSADCLILRQVLQHLSNKEVKQVVNKLYDFKYVILTEHIPKGVFNPNTDIISGQGIRLKKQSGINLLAPPFNFKIKKEKELLSINTADGKGLIKTTIYEVF